MKKDIKASVALSSPIRVVKISRNWLGFRTVTLEMEGGTRTLQEGDTLDYTLHTNLDVNQ